MVTGRSDSSPSAGNAVPVMKAELLLQQADMIISVLDHKFVMKKLTFFSISRIMTINHSNVQIGKSSRGNGRSENLLTGERQDSASL